MAWFEVDRSLDQDNQFLFMWQTTMEIYTIVYISIYIDI